MAGTSNYPNGFPQGVTIKGVPLTVTNPGKVFWLSNATTLSSGDRTGSDGNKGTYNSPFSTLNYAFTQCVAGRGDIIIVKPGHAENIASSTACTLAIAGVAVIGLGTGANRPSFTLTTANTATINVTAANISFTNCVFTGNFLSVAAALTLTTAKFFTLQNCWFTDTSSVLNLLNCVKSTGAANTIDGLTVLDCDWYGLGTTSVNSMVLSADAVSFATFQRNRVIVAAATDTSKLLTLTTGVLVGLDCGWNIVNSQQTATTAGSLINVGGTTSSGSVYWNFAGTLTTASDKLFTTTVGLWPFENRVTGVVGATGFVIPAVDS